MHSVVGYPDPVLKTPKAAHLHLLRSRHGLCFGFYPSCAWKVTFLHRKSRDSGPLARRGACYISFINFLSLFQNAIRDRIHLCQMNDNKFKGQECTACGKFGLCLRPVEFSTRQFFSFQRGQLQPAWLYWVKVAMRSEMPPSPGSV